MRDYFIGVLPKVIEFFNLANFQIGYSIIIFVG